MASDVPFRDLFAEPTKNGLTRPKRVRGSGIYMVNMGELFAHRRIGAIKMDRVPLSSNENSFLLESGDLLFARQSLVLSGAGQCSLFLGHNEPVTFESHLIRCRIDKSKADPRFLFYFFGSPAGRAALEPIIQQGAGASGLRASDLAKVSLPNVPIDEQRSVSNVLSILDDRIDHNRALAANLEAIARALFKSWFVDFDPVRAKAAGETPSGLAPDLAALFPDRFVDSELGGIPDGWREGRLSDLVELKYGKALKASERRNGKVPVYGSGGITGWHDEAIVEHATVIVGRKGSVGTLYWEDRSSFPIDTAFFVSPKAAPLTFCYYAMLGLGLDELNTDAAVPGLNRDNAYRQPVIIPPAGVLAAWDSIAGVLREKLRLLGEESEVLAQLRDLLLPRLISGKLRVEDAEAALEAA